MTTNNDTSCAPGDWIAHCYHGVGQIDDVERKSIGDQENTYYRIKMSDSTIWIPVDQMNDGQIRPVSGESDFQKAIEVLNSLPREMASNLSTRKSRIKRVTANNIPTETARLIRDLYARQRSSSGLNETERHALHDLTKRFVHEWAVCNGITIELALRRSRRRLENGRTATQSHPETDRKDREKQKESSLFDTLIEQDERWVEWLAQKSADGG